MEPLVEEARVAGDILEIVVLSLLLFGWSLFVQHRARVWRETEDLANNSGRADPFEQGRRDRL
jgi:hypothetical protein